jgi:spore germination protein KA
MVDRKIVTDNILTSLMLLSNLDIKDDNSGNVQNYITKHILPQHQLKVCKHYQDVIGEINFGSCGIFVDGMDVALAADIKGWEHRTVERPNNEIVLNGPQEGFTEISRVNSSLIRKILKDEKLILEDHTIGKRSKTACALMYVKDIANSELVDEVRRRIKGIRTDYIIDSGELEQFIEDSTLLPAPQMFSTERPDRVAGLLAEGKVAIILHGSPYVLVMPTNITELLHSGEDSNLRYPYINFLRIVRITGIILSYLLPGLYIAITNFHQEMIPTDLLFAIEASREKVPFPSIIELLIMEFAFEMIREAGVRVPGPIGPTLSIIGGLILGQAAVSANIVSPILIIVVAVTGIGSFAVPNISLGLMFRITRFILIILGSLAGFLGISLGLFIHSLFLMNANSMGVPLTVPITPKTITNPRDELGRGPIWKQEKRPDYLNVKQTEKQPKISRRWVHRRKDDKNGK